MPKAQCTCRLMVYVNARARESDDIHALKSRLRGGVRKLPSRWVDSLAETYFWPRLDSSLLHLCSFLPLLVLK